ncbi:unnamed protein product [Adineta ricciae]|uniref:Telomere length regulation protein TEL2 homolog n=1 Tax=Adineta ricciae TaxID=249248 RepID=A0A813Y4G7_ADIRI|nr:unnamed protein product [Adineta ricciae]
MSFERINLVLKQISASDSYSSVQSLLTQYFFDRTLQLTAVDQEKVVRLCLRKLPDWFSQHPEQVKEIKIDFHQHLLQTPILLTQKQIIDLILNEFQTIPVDYFIFLLNDIYEKNYVKLLSELEKENDIGYIIHLPDRITNISLTNIPSNFRAKIYFNRLSEYIEEQLITYHYPKMIAQTDTNVQFLCQLIHKAAKLGYTEYIWRRLYKNLFLIKCPTDSLWLRLAQYFLLETIDDVLLYTIQHGNAQTLDLFLSDRILHIPLLQTYLIDTLLFRKQLSIQIVRTILIYLTMSPNRIEQCFEKTFVRFLKLWSQESFIRFSSNEQHFYICQCICLCLSLHHHVHIQQDKDEIILCILNGIRIHLESTFDYIRRRGQFLGELIVERIDVFSNPNQLQFNTYDKNHPEIESLRKLAELNHSATDRALSDDEQQEIPKKKESPKSVSPSNIVVLHEASNDDDDDDDSEFETYDYSHDTIKSEVSKPSYIRSCLADLIATDKVPQLEAALHVLPSLIELYRIECEEVALELTRILLNYNSTFNIENFHELQLNGLVTLCKTYPLLISDYLCKQFYERNYTLNQRSLILKTIQETGKRLSSIDQIRTKIYEELFSSSDEEEEESWRSTINKRLKLKTKYKTKTRSIHQPILKENSFGNIVGYFFYPLISQIDQSTPHLSLIDGDSEHLLLCELLACLGRLCIHAQNTLILKNMVKQFLQVLKVLQQHLDAGVRHAVVYGYACCLVSIGNQCYDEDLQTSFIELKQWLDEMILKDTNTEVQKLARSYLIQIHESLTMLKAQVILMFICAQIFLINCFTLNHIPRPLWSESDGEINDELLSKLLRTEALLSEATPTIGSSAVGLFEQTDGHPRGLQKRGRQCLWKVCSWALDKRSLRSPSPSSTNSLDTLSKLLY